jgi:hypothetical protein
MLVVDCFAPLDKFAVGYGPPEKSTWNPYQSGDLLDALHVCMSGRCLGSSCSHGCSQPHFPVIISLLFGSSFIGTHRVIQGCSWVWLTREHRSHSVRHRKEQTGNRCKMQSTAQSCPSLCTRSKAPTHCRSTPTAQPIVSSPKSMHYNTRERRPSFYCIPPGLFILHSWTALKPARLVLWRVHIILTVRRFRTWSCKSRTLHIYFRSAAHVIFMPRLQKCQG